MPTNLAIDDRLLEEAKKIGGFKTKKEAVNQALREFIQKHKRVEILKFFGKVEMLEGYDYRKDRRRR